MRVLEISMLPHDKRIGIRIDMPDPNCFLTSQVPHVPRGLFRLLPRLQEHTCDNPSCLTFRQECRNTEIPHLFEHLVLELQLQAQQNPDDLLRGETVWNWQQDPRGRFHVYVEYENELLAIACIRLAERILNQLDRRDLRLDMDTEIALLRQIMAMGQQASAVSSPAKQKASSVRRSSRHRRRASASWAAEFMPGAGDAVPISKTAPLAC